MLMKILLSLSLFAIWTLCLFCFAFTSSATSGSSLDDYVGQWVMKLGQRNFIVLTLKIDQGKLTGSLSRPKSFKLDAGSNFSEISSNTKTAVIVALY